MILNFKTTASALLFVLQFSIVIAQSEYLRGFRMNLPNEVIQFQLNDTEFNNTDRLFLFSNLINDTTSLWMQTHLQISALSGYFSDNQNSPANVLRPLYKNYISSQSLSTLKTILGSVSFGATTYLAYKHLKKYGFLKKK